MRPDHPLPRRRSPASIRPITKRRSPAWYRVSVGEEFPVASLTVVGNVGAATTYPARAQASARSPRASGSPSSPCATTINGSRRVPPGSRTCTGRTRHGRRGRVAVAGVTRRRSTNSVLTCTTPSAASVSSRRVRRGTRHAARSTAVAIEPAEEHAASAPPSSAAVATHAAVRANRWWRPAAASPPSGGGVRGRTGVMRPAPARHRRPRPDVP